MRVISRRTTARGVALFAALATVAVIAAGGSAAPPGKVPRLVFPVVGPVTYQDDFGEQRAKWPHPGNDLLAPRRAIAVAAEAGKVRFWTTSATAGCMLYLYGQSGTSYQYIHLNNDLGAGNDNRGKCVSGTAYVPGLVDGASVEAGQPLGFVGDSGDANGIHPHLHFEVHPADGQPVDPYPYLRKAVHLLFAADPTTTVSITAEGIVTATAGSRLTLRITSIVVFPLALKLQKLGRPLVLGVPGGAQLDTGSGSVETPDAAALESLVGKNVVVLTEPTPATLSVALFRPGALSASRIAVGPTPSLSGP